MDHSSATRLLQPASAKRARHASVLAVQLGDEAVDGSAGQQSREQGTSSAWRFDVQHGAS